jgi:N-acetylneuraminate synthase
MKFGIVYYWRDPVEIFELAQDFLELRVFEYDINEKYKTWISKVKELRKYWEEDITVHISEYFTHPKTGESNIIDLSSTDKDMYNLSLKVVRSLVDFTKSIGANKLIIHPGGITPEKRENMRLKQISQLKNSLIEISTWGYEGEILLENMPWFYWLSDGRRWNSNICILPEDFDDLLLYCDGMVLDLSHGFLSTSRGSDKNLETFAKRFKNQIHYLHVSDALPPDNEGLQIGEGNINFDNIFKTLDKNKLWLVPEIWKGHENFGEGFQIALDRINDLI